jgi:hypothetical protein
MRVHTMAAGSCFMGEMYKLKCLISVAVWENTQRFVDGIRQKVVGLESLDLDHFCTKGKAV